MDKEVDKLTNEVLLTAVTLPWLGLNTLTAPSFSHCKLGTKNATSNQHKRSVLGYLQEV